MRVFAVCLGFNTAEMVGGSLVNFSETTTDFEHRQLVKTLFQLGYPRPSPEENAAALQRIGELYGWWVTPMSNDGVVENHNKAIFDYCRIQDGDFYITWDPDVRMRQTGWVTAMVDALRAQPNCAFVAAARSFHDEAWCVNQHGRTISVVDRLVGGPLRIARWRELVAWSVGMYPGWWLKNYMGRHFAAENPIYGYGEHAQYALMQRHGKHWCSLVDYYDDHQGAEPLYTQWKSESAAKRTTAKFEEWVRGR